MNHCPSHDPYSASCKKCQDWLDALRDSLYERLFGKEDRAKIELGLPKAKTL